LGTIQFSNNCDMALSDGKDTKIMPKTQAIYLNLNTLIFSIIFLN